MKFVRKNINSAKYIDSIFQISFMAKEDPLGINASLGCLYDENGELFTFKSVYDNEHNISNINNASYANPIGNREYLELIRNYIFDKKVSNNSNIMATAGGTGAIYTAIKSCLDEKDTIILPEIGWGNYSVIAQELNLNVINYDIYDVESLLNQIDKISDKVFVVINSPCHNPCGHRYSFDEWKIIIDKINNCDKEVIILNDIAYIDYASSNAKDYFKLFNNINDNVLILLAYSCSKSFSYYGKRVGALVAINNDKEFLDTYINYCTRIARTTWSNINNGAMQNIADVLINHYQEYIDEREKAIQMLNKRSELFISEAKKCGLECYPYYDGFFIALKIENQDKRDLLHKKLLENHIYTIKVKNGLRVGICCLPLNKLAGLAEKINQYK